MTPFMLKVSEVLELPTEIDLPQLRSSRPQPAAAGAEEHVECRSLAEQLVCEANVVLASAGQQRLTLVDDVRTAALSFSISHEGRGARVVTDVGRKVATGHLYGIGARHLSDVELAGADQLERLILLLIAGDPDGAETAAVPAPGTLTL